MLSNSDPTNVNPDDTFFPDNYNHAEFKIVSVNASRMINSVTAKRGEIRELIILNYENI